MPGSTDSTLYIGNLDERVDERLVYEIMVQAGPLVDVHMPRDKETKRHKGYAFAEFSSEKSAQYALSLFSGLLSLYNRALRLAISGGDRPAQSTQTLSGVDKLEEHRNCVSEKPQQVPEEICPVTPKRMREHTGYYQQVYSHKQYPFHLSTSSSAPILSPRISPMRGHDLTTTDSLWTTAAQIQTYNYTTNVPLWNPQTFQPNVVSQTQSNQQGFQFNANDHTRSIEWGLQSNAFTHTISKQGFPQPKAVDHTLSNRWTCHHPVDHCPLNSTGSQLNTFNHPQSSGWSYDPSSVNYTYPTVPSYSRFC